MKNIFPFLTKYNSIHTILFLTLLIIVLFHFINLSIPYSIDTFQNKHKIKPELPKKIFTYWNEVEITNPLVKKNIEMIQKILPPDFTFTIFNEKTILNELGEDIKYKYHDMTTDTNFSDFIRYYLIYKYGGTWIDSTYFILDFQKAILDKYKMYEENPFDAGYYEFSNRSIGNKINEKYYESWFMIAPAKNAYIGKVLEEFKQGATIGFKKYKEDLKKQNINLKNLIEGDNDYYLMIYAMVRKVLTLHPNYKIQTFDLNHVLFNFWNEDLFQKLLNPKELKQYEAIKLTGSHRSLIIKHNKEQEFLDTLDKFYTS
jgi:hypothetical protein